VSYWCDAELIADDVSSSADSIFAENCFCCVDSAKACDSLHYFSGSAFGVHRKCNGRNCSGPRPWAEDVRLLALSS